MKQKITIKTINRMLEKLEKHDITFDDIKEEMRELDKKFAETSVQLQETREIVRQTGEQMKETDRQMKETDRKIKELGEFYDGLAKNTGAAVEEYFYHYFQSHKQIGDIHFDMVKHPLISGDAEYDIALINGEYCGIIECKHKFHPKDVHKFVEKMLPRFKIEFAQYNQRKIIAGIASYVFPADTIELALEHGLYLFTQAGNDVKILNDNQFVATTY